MGGDAGDRTEAAQRVIVALLGAADATRRRLEGVMQRFGLTLQQYNVLRILRGVHPDPLPTMEIAERMIEKTPGVTRFLDRLEEEGLVRRERSSEDRRRVHAWITAEGLARLDEMDEPVDAADRKAIDGLGSAEVDRLVDALEAVRRNNTS